MTLQQQFISTIQQKNLFNPKDKLLLAISGGIDSVVLYELCFNAGFDFAIAHCNFQLRGEESERDEKFVKELGNKYNKEVKTIQFNTDAFAQENKLSIQEAARTLRYDWFASLIKEQGFDYLLTAHHADDNIETLLLHFFRGTGLQGLTGIPEKNNYIRRPLLSFTKNQLLHFAQQHNLSFVEDSSNASDKYSRNFFRNQLLPQIEKVYPTVRENLSANIERFKAVNELYTASVNQIKKKLLVVKGDEIHIPIRLLKKYDNTALVYDIISEYDFTEKQISEIEKLSESESGKFIISPSGKYRIIKHRNWFIISPQKEKSNTLHTIEDGQSELEFAAGKLLIQKTDLQSLPTDKNIAVIDATLVQFPLVLRQWKTGDYFYPLGMKKKKKVARFLIDQKLSKTEKENVWVLESNKKIIWVVGQRIDNRFKITSAAKNTVNIRLL